MKMINVRSADLLNICRTLTQSSHCVLVIDVASHNNNATIEVDERMLKILDENGFAHSDAADA